MNQYESAKAFIFTDLQVLLSILRQRGRDAAGVRERGPTRRGANMALSAGFVAGATSDSDGLVYSADAASVEFDYSTGTDLNIQKNAGTYEE